MRREGQDRSLRGEDRFKNVQSRRGRVRDARLPKTGNTLSSLKTTYGRTHKTLSACARCGF
jgi:hypothetical protein